MNKLLYYSSSKSQNNLELCKDPGEIPYYINKLFSYNVVIDDYNDVMMPPQRFCKIRLLRKRYSNPFLNSLIKLIRLFTYARKINILYLLQITPDSLIKMLLYRIGGGKGKIYLKLDLGVYSKNGNDLLVWENMGYFLKAGHLIFKRLPDIYTVETRDNYNRLSQSYYKDLIPKNKLFILPNGFDPQSLTENGIVPYPLYRKEKIILSVGRIGNWFKNSELLLDIISDIELKEWKVYIVGPIEDHFKKSIEEFYCKNPSKKDSVIFTGPIYDKKCLYEYYNRSRVFLFTSIYESYGFVLTEATYMHNYIISTNVGIAKELLDYTSGFVCNSHEKTQFVNELNRITHLSDNDLNTLVPGKEITEITWEHILSRNPAIMKLMSR